MNTRIGIIFTLLVLFIPLSYLIFNKAEKRFHIFGAHLTQNHEGLLLNQKVEEVFNVFKRYALTYDIDKKSIDPTIVENLSACFTGKVNFIKKISNLISKNVPLEMNFVGFPYKSSNTKNKVIQSKIDMAERFSLGYLQQFINELSAIYKPGAKLTIFTDGLIFCDLEGVADSVVIEYENELKKLAKDLPNITFITFNDLLPSKSPQEIREIINSYPPSVTEFNKRIIEDAATKEELVILEKRTAFELNLTSNEHAQTIRSIATQMLLRSLRYSKFLARYRQPEAIRLSVHYQKDISEKFGIKLSPKSFVTPWHGVLVQANDGTKYIAHKGDVFQMKYEITQEIINGIPCAFLKQKN